MTRLLTILLGLVLALNAFGAEPAEAPANQPILLHLPGIAGEMEMDRLFIRGLVEGGVKGEFRIYDWVSFRDAIQTTRNQKANRETSKKVAGWIEQWKRENPQRRIILTAHSAGTGIAVWALEDLPEGVEVDQVYLIQSALSPDYDLSKALKRSKMTYVFSSRLDSIVLGAMTLAFWTMDGQRSAAAGMLGFKTPPGADAELYEKKLVNIPYRDEWAAEFENFGSHVCSMKEGFAKGFIAPIMNGGQLPPPTTRPAEK